MGLDLTLMPFYANDPTCSLAHTMIDCERRRDLFDAILPIEEKRGRDVPADFRTFRSREDDQDSHYGLTIETPYGERLKYVRAIDLMPLASHEGVTDNPLNRAAWAYLKELPGTWPIALYWH